MVAGYHLLWTAYGWWLPNDPRGGMSREIRAAAIAPLGELHYGRKKIQPAARDVRKFYEQASATLKHPLLKFSAREVATIGAAFAKVVRDRSYTCYACAVMPDHVHMLIRKHRDDAPTMIEALQEESRTAVLALGNWPADHPVWGGPGWKVFLETVDDFERTIRYIENNPIRIGRPRQARPFVQPYNGWLPGQLTKHPPAKTQARRRTSRRNDDRK